MDRVANSTPMVDLESRLNSLRVNRLRRLDFPTPESPIRTTEGTRMLATPAAGCGGVPKSTAMMRAFGGKGRHQYL